MEIAERKNDFNLRADITKALAELKSLKGLVKALESDYWVPIEAIETLRDLGHIEGLIRALRNRAPEVRIEAAEALKEIGNDDALQRLSEALVATLKYGEFLQKIEAITMIRGRGYSTFLTGKINKQRAKHYERLQRTLPLELVQPALLSEATNESSPAFIRWYTAVTLAELGGRSESALNVLILAGEKFVNMHYRPEEESLTLERFGGWVRDETLRVLSFFKGNSKARDTIIKALEGHILVGGYDELPLRQALFALCALGDPDAHERLEYMASYGMWKSEH